MTSLLFLLGGTIGIAATQLAVAVALAGVGLLMRRCYGPARLTLRDATVAFWVGLVVANVFLMLWHFLLPVTSAATAVVLVAGVIGLYGSRQALSEAIEGEAWAKDRRVILLVVVCWLWVANLSRGPLQNTDTGLYHLQGVLWNKTYPVVPGLANLFGPLGFNNASLLYDAMLDVGPWSGQANHLANGVLVQVLLFGGVTALVRAARISGEERSEAIFDAVLLIPVVNLALQDWLTSFATDLPSLALQFVTGAQALRLSLADEGRSRQEAEYTWVTVALLGAAAVTFKISSAVWIALTLTWCTVGWIRRGGFRPDVRRAVTWVVVGLSLTGGVWAVRGVLLSGYPMFPMPSMGLPVPWRAPVEHAAAEYAFAAHSARASTENAAVVLGQSGMAGWLPEWWAVLATRDPYMLLIPAVLSVTLAAGFHLRRRSGALAAFGPIGLLLPCLVAMLTWFLMAPEPRYVLAVVWVAVAILAAAHFGGAASGSPPRATRGPIAVIAILALSPLLVTPILNPQWRIRKQSVVRRLLWTNFLLPGEALWVYPNSVKPKGQAIVTETGIRLVVPQGRCWDLPIACTPNPAPNVRLRQPGNLGGGFIVDGAWQMQDWPNPNRREFGELWRRRTSQRQGAPAP